jgi:hypothetical protein
VTPDTPVHSKPLPCPFCGNVDVGACPGHDNRSWTVACRAKSAECPMEITVIECFSKEQAIAAWNRRASSLGEPVSQEAPYDWEGSYTMLRDALEANFGEFIRDGEEAEEHLYVQGIERAASVISSASPLSEKDVALVNELRYSAARAKVNVVLEVAEAAALCDLIARLSTRETEPPTWERKTKPWRDYPLGTEARNHSGMTWTRVADGWKAKGGDTFPTPAGDAWQVLLP